MAKTIIRWQVTDTSKRPVHNLQGNAYGMTTSLKGQLLLASTCQSGPLCIMTFSVLQHDFTGTLTVLKTFIMLYYHFGG